MKILIGILVYVQLYLTWEFSMITLSMAAIKGVDTNIRTSVSGGLIFHSIFNHWHSLHYFLLTEH